MCYWQQFMREVGEKAVVMASYFVAAEFAIVNPTQNLFVLFGQSLIYANPLTHKSPRNHPANRRSDQQKSVEEKGQQRAGHD